MYRPYKLPTVKASSSFTVPPPRISRLAIFICGLLGRVYLFFIYGMAKVVLHEDAILFDSFKRALSGESRCILAFRHPSGGEPELLSWFFLFKLKRYAAKKGVRFARDPHALFIYGYEVINWGGWVPRAVMPKLGAMPVHHSKIDRQGMERIINALTAGPYPVALAPEGQVSYTADAVPRLESGVVRIGFHAAELLGRKNVSSPVEVLPLSLQFRYGPRGKIAMERLLVKIEKVTGINGPGRDKLSLTERLSQCREHVLEANEARYNIKGDKTASFEERLDQVIKCALETGEGMIGLKGEGDLVSRMYRLRQSSWDRIVIPGTASLDGLSRVERSIKDLQAGEAWYVGRHQEIVDFCWYFRIPLPTEDVAIHSKIEYVQNLWDFASRTMGGAYADRKRIFPRDIIIHAAPAINLSASLPSYLEDKKAAVSSAMSDLEKAYLDCIEEAGRGDF